MTTKRSPAAAGEPLSGARFFLVTAILGGVTATGVMSIDASLPAMPAIAEAMGTNAAGIRFTLSAYILGVATGQLVHGPVSDRFGRRPVLLLGMLGYLLASLACAAAGSVTELAAARYVQGFAGASGTILARAVVRDMFDRSHAARVMSYLLAVMGLGPIFFPLAGGFLVEAFGWPSVFVLMACYGAMLMVLVWWNIGETLDERDHRATRPLTILINFRTVIANRTFVAYLLCMLCVYAALFTYLGGAAGVIIGHLGYSPAEFGWIYPITFTGQIGAHLFGGRLVHHFGLDRLLRAGCFLAAAGGLAMGICAWTGVDRVEAFVAPMFFVLIGLGLAMPMGMAGAMSPFPHIAGAASSLMGLVQFTTASVMVALLGVFDDGTGLPMATMIAVLGIAAPAVYFLLVARLPDRPTEFAH